MSQCPQQTSNKSGMARAVTPGHGRSPGAKTEISIINRQSPIMAQPVTPGDARSPVSVKIPTAAQTPASKSFSIGSGVRASSRGASQGILSAHGSARGATSSAGRPSKLEREHH